MTTDVPWQRSADAAGYGGSLLTGPTVTLGATTEAHPPSSTAC